MGCITTHALYEAATLLRTERTKTMKTLAILAFFVIGCTESSVDSTHSSVLDGSDCPAGSVESWRADGSVDCSPVAWPPAATGNRSMGASCAVSDGVYSVAWTAEDPTHRDTTPAFIYTRTLTISGNTLKLDDYAYELQWVNAGSANVYDSTHRDLNFEIHADCASGKIVGRDEVDLPWFEPDAQVQAFLLTATKR